MNDYAKQMQDAAQAFGEQLKAAMPRVTLNKNGYEIRAQVLEMAQTQSWQDYYAKWGQFETSTSKDGKDIVVKVEMPAVPGADTVLEAAEKFYNFVNGNVGKKD
jgi:aspartokinase